jgi:hypothetical protein
MENVAVVQHFSRSPVPNDKKQAVVLEYQYDPTDMSGATKYIYS